MKKFIILGFISIFLIITAVGCVDKTETKLNTNKMAPEWNSMSEIQKRDCVEKILADYHNGKTDDETVKNYVIRVQHFYANTDDNGLKIPVEYVVKEFLNEENNQKLSNEEIYARSTEIMNKLQEETNKVEKGLKNIQKEAIDNSKGLHGTV